MNYLSNDKDILCVILGTSIPSVAFYIVTAQSGYDVPILMGFNHDGFK